MPEQTTPNATAASQDVAGIGEVGQVAMANGNNTTAAVDSVAAANAMGGRPASLLRIRFTPMPYSSAAPTPAITAQPVLRPAVFAPARITTPAKPAASASVCRPLMRSP